MTQLLKITIPAMVLAASAFYTSPALGLTVTIDGVSSPTLLSDAVDTCMTAGAGPHTINITTDTLATADRQVFINNSITINGDADNNNTPCDILVDMTGIRAASDVGVIGWKSYIEVQCAGTVAVNNLRIHPNADGANAAAANSALQNVSGVRFFRPVNASDVGTYNFTKVGVSGSDTSDAYIDLASSTDFYDQSGVKRWASFNGAQEVNFVQQSAIAYNDDPAVTGAGTIVSTLDHCQAGLSKGTGVNIEGVGVNVTILGGVFGHVGRDAIRVADSATLTAKGTLTDRVRVVRATNITGGNSHCVEVVNNGIAALLEYIDVAGEQTANGFAFRDGTVTEVNSVRILGKFAEIQPTNHGMYLGSAGISVGLVKNSTIVGDGSPIGDPLGIVAAVVNPVEFRDTIFTTKTSGETLFVGSTTPNVATFNNCCLTTDGLAGESMADPPITGAGYDTPGVLNINNCIFTSPQYMLTLVDYDWSDNQGASNPLNGAGNRNVLRPSNLAYLTASSTGGPLVGGAGPAVAGISDWELMEN